MEQVIAPRSDDFVSLKRGLRLCMAQQVVALRPARGVEGGADGQVQVQRQKRNTGVLRCAQDDDVGNG